MKHVIIAGIMAALLATGAAPRSAQTAAKAGMSLGSVTINHKVSADGKAARRRHLPGAPDG